MRKDELAYTANHVYREGYEDGRADVIEDIEDIIADIERCCINHTENDCGEWVTYTVDYDVWADVFIRLRELKEQGKVTE